MLKNDNHGELLPSSINILLLVITLKLYYYYIKIGLKEGEKSKWKYA